MCFTMQILYFIDFDSFSLKSVNSRGLPGFSKLGGLKTSKTSKICKQTHHNAMFFNTESILLLILLVFWRLENK